MIDTYLKIAVRSLIKNKRYLLINSTSLAISLTICWFIINYTQFEKSYDSFYPGVESLYRIQSKVYQGDELVINDSRTTVSLFDVAKDEIPGVEQVCRFFYEDVLLFTERATLSNQAFYWADSTFFDLFDIPFVYGSSEGSLDNVHSMVISESLANTLFGEVNPVGQTIYFNESLPFEVTGVFRDLPANSNLKFTALATFSTNFAYGWISRNENWHNRYVITWVKTTINTTPQQLADGLKRTSDKYLDMREQQNQHTLLYPVNATELHFTQPGLTREIEPTISLRLIAMLKLVALFILAIALVNVLNYVIAKTIERLNESGIRKIHGANARQLILQFSVEAIYVILIAIFLGTALFYPAAKYFSYLLEIPFKNLYTINASIVGFTLLLFVIISSVIGVITVFFINSYRVQDVLKGKVTQSRKEINFRKVLVIFQFTASIILFLVLLAIYKQIRFMQTTDLGINKNSVVVVDVPFSLNSLPERRQKFRAFEQELLMQAGVDEISNSLHVPGQVVQSNSIHIRTRNNPDPRTVPLTIFRTDHRYFDVFDIALLKGRVFRDDTIDANAIVVNQKALQLLGFTLQNAVNEEVTILNGNFRIIGVVEDFHHNSLQYPIEPAIFTTRKPPYWGYFAIRYSGVFNAHNLQKIERVYKSHFPNDPFNYQFMNSLYNQQFRSDIQTGKILSIFSVLVLIISLLGIFGISVYFTNRRIKEIGVRKVMGASTNDVLFLLNKTIAGWVLLSFLLACPIAYFAVDKWLDNFAYATDIPYLGFVITGLVVLKISVLTVSMQSFRCAQMNPVIAIRAE